MNLQDSIRDKALEIQNCTEKARVLANILTESEGSSQESYTMGFFIETMIKEIQTNAEAIEMESLEIKS